MENNDINYQLMPQAPEEWQPQRSNKKRLFIGGGFIVIIILVVSVIIFSGGRDAGKKISDGIEIKLGEGEDFKFKSDGENHKLSVIFIGKDGVKLNLQSNSFNFSLDEGEEETFDLDGDKIDDVLVKLVDVKDSRVFLYIKEIVDAFKEGAKEIGEAENKMKEFQVSISESNYTYKGEPTPLTCNELITAEEAANILNLNNEEKQSMAIFGLVKEEVRYDGLLNCEYFDDSERIAHDELLEVRYECSKEEVNNYYENYEIKESLGLNDWNSMDDVGRNSRIKWDYNNQITFNAVDKQGKCYIELFLDTKGFNFLVLNNDNPPRDYINETFALYSLIEKKLETINN